MMGKMPNAVLQWMYTLSPMVVHLQPPFGSFNSLECCNFEINLVSFHLHVFDSEQDFYINNNPFMEI